MLATAHVEVENWVLRPLGLQILDSQSLEQLFATCEITVQSGGKKRFSKPPRAAKKYILAIAIRQLIH